MSVDAPAVSAPDLLLNKTHQPPTRRQAILLALPAVFFIWTLLGAAYCVLAGILGHYIADGLLGWGVVGSLLAGPTSWLGWWFLQSAISAEHAELARGET